MQKVSVSWEPLDLNSSALQPLDAFSKSFNWRAAYEGDFCGAVLALQVLSLTYTFPYTLVTRSFTDYHAS